MRNISAVLKHPHFIWGAIILFAFIFFLAGVSHESLWCDEAYSAIMTDYSFADLLKYTTLDVHPPLYYCLLKIFRTIVGNSEWALRLLSVLCATGMVALGAGPVRRIFGDKTAYIYAAAALFTPIKLIMAHEVRMYSPAMFTVTASALYGLAAVKENSKRDWLIFGIAVLASAYLHYYGLIAVFFVNLSLFVWMCIKKREALKRFIITAGIVIMAYLPWIYFFIGQIKKVDNAFWVTPVQPLTILLSFLQPFFTRNFFPRKASPALPHR